ncbi:MAG: class I SAM-dependent methyltransferase [Planctomycetales bacterium]|nr:class I SAM-dependent methyltransferase [bacterium]UNM09876.1 MAG: class I SAM-dependent methyltransferase [Planctomycetales bacterium]
MTVNFGTHAQDYADHRPGYPAKLYDMLERYRIGGSGQRILDLGCGTGLFSRELARRGADVTGLDVSHELIEQANRLDTEAGVSLDYVVATAEETFFPDASFDVITAAACWHWFEHDAATAEVQRILRDGGELVTLWYYWLPLPGTACEATEQLILKYNPAWPYHSKLGGFDGALKRFTADNCWDIQGFLFDTPVAFTHEQWRRRMFACAGMGASGVLSDEQKAAFDNELEEMLAARFPGELSIPHRIPVLIMQRR